MFEDLEQNFNAAQTAEWVIVREDTVIVLVGRGFSGQAISDGFPTTTSGAVPGGQGGSVVPGDLEHARGQLCPSRVKCAVFSVQFVCHSSTCWAWLIYMFTSERQLWKCVSQKGDGRSNPFLCKLPDNNISATCLEAASCACLQIGIAGCLWLLVARGFQACNTCESLKCSRVLSSYLARSWEGIACSFLWLVLPGLEVLVWLWRVLHPAEITEELKI